MNFVMRSRDGFGRDRDDRSTGRLTRKCMREDDFVRSTFCLDTQKLKFHISLSCSLCRHYHDLIDDRNETWINCQ